jgi:hypothetical protein
VNAGPQRHKDLLQDVLSLSPVSQDSKDQVIQLPVVPIVQLTDRAFIASVDPFDQGDVDLALAGLRTTSVELLHDGRILSAHPVAFKDLAGDDRAATIRAGMPHRRRRRVFSTAIARGGHIDDGDDGDSGRAGAG